MIINNWNESEKKIKKGIWILVLYKSLYDFRLTTDWNYLFNQDKVVGVISSCFEQNYNLINLFWQCPLKSDP